MALAGVGETSLNKLLRSTFAQVSPQPGPRDFSWRNQDFDQRSACPFVLHAKLASAEKEWSHGCWLQLQDSLGGVNFAVQHARRLVCTFYLLLASTHS